MASPQVVSALALNQRQLQITFNAVPDLDPVSAGLATNYNIPGRTVESVLSVGTNVVLLEVWPKWKNGDAYVVEVNSSVKNNINEYINPSFKSAAFVGVASTPTLVPVSTQALTSRRIRAVFSFPMSKDIELLDVGNYVLTPVTPGASQVAIVDVKAPNNTTPDYVDLETTEMTNGMTYTLFAIGMKDLVGNAVAGSTSASILGIGVRPVIANIAAISANRVDVKFSEAMVDNSDLRNPAKYTFDNGLVVLQVLEVDGDTVRLATTDQQPNLVYTLTVVP